VMLTLSGGQMECLWELTAMINGKTTRVTDRSRSVGRAVRAIAKALARRTGQAKAEAMKLNERAGRLIALSERGPAARRAGQRGGAWPRRTGQAQRTEQIQISGHHEPGSRKILERRAHYRTGCTSHLQRGCGLRRTQLKGDDGTRTWTGWATLAYDLDTLAIHTPTETLPLAHSPPPTGSEARIGMRPPRADCSLAKKRWSGTPCTLKNGRYWLGGCETWLARADHCIICDRSHTQLADVPTGADNSPGCPGQGSGRAGSASGQSPSVSSGIPAQHAHRFCSAAAGGRRDRTGACPS
jgi:hypothetical protein